MLHPSRRAAVALAAGTALAALSPASAAAQRFPSFGGAEMRIGAASADDADVGFSVSAEADVGSPWAERLHLLLGANLFTGDVDRTAGGQPVVGGFRAFGPRAALRLDFPSGTRLTPYLMAQASAHLVRASDVAHGPTRDRLEEWHAGGGVGAGLAYVFGVLRTTSATVEARRTEAGDMSHWALEVGLRYTPPRDDEEDAAARARVEADRRRIANERRRPAEPPERAIRIPVELIPALQGIAREPGSVLRVAETGRGMELELARAAFAGGDAEPTAAARRELQRVGAELARHPDATIAVEASAPDGLTGDADRALAMRRAQAVRAALVAGGVAEQRVAAVAGAIGAAGGGGGGSGVRIVVAARR